MLGWDWPFVAAGQREGWLRGRAAREVQEGLEGGVQACRAKQPPTLWRKQASAAVESFSVGLLTGAGALGSPTRGKETAVARTGVASLESWALDSHPGPIHLTSLATRDAQTKDRHSLRCHSQNLMPADHKPEDDDRRGAVEELSASVALQGSVEQGASRHGSMRQAKADVHLQDKRLNSFFTAYSCFTIYS